MGDQDTATVDCPTCDGHGVLPSSRTHSLSFLGTQIYNSPL